MRGPVTPTDPDTTDRRGAPDGAADIAQPLLSALTALIAAGQRIEAIKRYRLATGADLVTAKGVVDALAAARPRQDDGAGATPAPRWRMQTTIPFTLDKAIGILRLFALFFWLCALLAAIAAGWQAYDRDTVRRTWPQADAEVVACRLVDHESRRHTIDLWTLKEVGPTLSLACTFRYSVDGRPYTGETRSHSSYAPALTAAMQRWARDHAPGSRQSIYYDPAKPHSISLGDADAGFEPDTVEHRLQLALLFGAAGVLLFGGGLWLAAVKQRREASSGGA
jgi:uncharacterized protein DUF3592